jgi:quinoprotein glucose dehydrogenase
MAGTSDGKIRAFDLDSGNVLWSFTLPAAGLATPMTYSRNGRQYVVVAAGGSNTYPGPISDTLVAFALPNEDDSSHGKPDK